MFLVTVLGMLLVSVYRVAKRMPILKIDDDVTNFNSQSELSRAIEQPLYPIISFRLKIPYFASFVGSVK